MDKEFLSNYQAREAEEYKKLVVNKIENGTFNFNNDKYPPDKRFYNLKRPVTDSTFVNCFAEDRWNQVPFSGSTIICLDALPPATFEKFYFKISEIPKVIDFIKETGKIQIALQDPPQFFEGLSYLDPFFNELEPPHMIGINYTAFVTEKNLKEGFETFNELSKIRFLDFYSKICKNITQGGEYFSAQVNSQLCTFSIQYAFLKVRYPLIAQQIEDSLIDNPLRALLLLTTSSSFIIDPLIDARCDFLTNSFDEIKRGKTVLGQAIDPNKIRFPCEIGKFLIKKLTYAPKGLRACNELIDHYNSYDLEKVSSSLNDAISKNAPDIVQKNVSAFSEILDNVWNDKTIVNRIQGLRIGVPFSLVALGEVVAGPIGGIGGLLAGLGFDVANRLLEANSDGLYGTVAKRLTQNYQVNIFDFKQKYKAQLVS